MKKNIFTNEDIENIKVAIGETISVLKNRFTTEDKSLHPAKKFEELYDKITELQKEKIISNDSVGVKHYTIEKILNR